MPGVPLQVDKKRKLLKAILGVVSTKQLMYHFQPGLSEAVSSKSSSKSSQ